MPTVQQVGLMCHKHVCIDLVRIRKSIYKGQKHAELRISLDERKARSYLILLVSGHHMNYEIREHERQMTEKEPLEFAPANDDKDDGRDNVLIEEKKVAPRIL